MKCGAEMKSVPGVDQTPSRRPHDVIIMKMEARSRSWLHETTYRPHCQCMYQRHYTCTQDIHTYIHTYIMYVPTYLEVCFGWQRYYLLLQFSWRAFCTPHCFILTGLSKCVKGRENSTHLSYGIHSTLYIYLHIFVFTYHEVKHTVWLFRCYHVWSFFVPYGVTSKW